MGFKSQLIVTLVLILTSTIMALAGYFLYFQHEQLRNQFDTSIKRELKTLQFLSSRAVLDQDDLALNDSLNNLKSLQGFVAAEFYGADRTTRLATVLLDQASSDFMGIKDLPERQEIKVIDLAEQTVYQYQEIVLHPFIKDQPPILGYALVYFSDDYILIAIRDSFLTVALSAVIILLLAAFIAIRVSEKFSQPVVSLSQASQRVSQGELDFSIAPAGSKELKSLIEQFNTMVKDLLVAREERDEQLVINEQIRQAQEIQEGMNPARFIRKPDIEIKGFTRAAKGVGGDYYDFRIMPDGRYALLICDVTGKSISASLVMVLIKTIFSTWLKLYDIVRPDQVLELINKVMSAEAHIDKLASILFCLYDPLSKELEFSNGGHGPLYIFRAQNQQMTGSQLPGLPMGIDEDNEYKVSKIVLEPGDVILLFTDGITEARNEAKEEYGLDRLQKIVRGCFDNDAKEITKQVIADVDNFAGEATQHDDITFLTLRVPAQRA